MSRESVVVFLSLLRGHLHENWGTNGAQNIFEHYSHQGILFFPSEWTAPLERHLRGFLPLSENHFLATGNSSSKIDFHHVATAMIERLVLGTSEEQIVKDWEHLLTTCKGTAISVTALLGVQLSSSIILAPDIRVVRAEDIPGSREREALFRIGRTGEPVFSFDIFQERWRLPSAAVLVEFPNFTLIKDGSPGTEALTFLERVASIKQRVLAALILSGDGSPVYTWSYAVGVHPALPYNGLGGSGGSGNLMPPPIHQGIIDEALLPNVYASLNKLSENVWTSLNLSIGRLGRSRGHMSPADRAIDLGIAIETLFLHREGGPGAKGELRNKVGTRGAWLLGRTPEERESVFRVLRAAYDARSQAVHSGSISPKNISVLEEADAICARLLRTIVQAGRYPDWDKLVLGFLEQP